MFGVTAIAAYPQETVLQTAAFEVLLEFPLDLPRQCRVLCRQMGQVILDDALVSSDDERRERMKAILYQAA